MTTPKEEKKELLYDKTIVDHSDTADLNFKPVLYDIHKVLDLSIVGDDLSRMALFTNWLMSNRPVLISGPRSSGKTYLADSVSTLIGDNCYTLNKGSDKSGWYQAEGFMTCTHVKVIEYGKLPNDMIETLKDWGEGKDSSYSVTVENPYNKKKYVQTKTLLCRPFCLCLADENDGVIPVELRSRITEIRTDSTIEQNMKVMAYQANLAMTPKTEDPVTVDLKYKIKFHILTMPPLDKFEYKHPAADIFLNAIPNIFTDCRREFPKYLYNTYGIARFHWKERMIFKSNDEFVMLITPQDMWLNHNVFGKALIDSAMKCNVVEKEILNILKSSTGDYTINMVQKALRSKGMNVNSKTVKKHLENLSDIGYAAKTQVTGTNTLFAASDFFHEFTFEIDWNKVISKCRETVNKYYPSLANEYEERFLKSPCVIHPFTGETIELLKTIEKQESIPFEEFNINIV